MNLIPRLINSSSSEDDEDYPVRRIRYVRPRNNPFLDFDDIDFKTRYRLSKRTVTELLETIGQNLQPLSERNNPVSAMNQLLIALRFYATGSFQIGIGDYFNVSKSTVCRIVPRVTKLIAQLRPLYVRFPNDRQSLQKIKQGFYDIRGFPGIIGALDCTHVKIKSPGGDQGEIFRNRKGYFSINVQALCDSQTRVLDIVARWPGSTHDMSIFNDSLLRARFEANEFANCYILGDNGYACKKYLLTPLLNTNTPAEIRYNASHIATRNPVERLFGVVKRRFPCLSFGMQIDVQKVLEVIVATFVLHNICVDSNEELEDNDIEAAEGNDFENILLTREAGNENTAIRTSLINTVFNT